jgi:uncharacterized protein involved in exopolysaccharide biosynthesis
MDTLDNSDSSNQGPLPAPARRIGLRSIVRGLARRWWKILLLWVVVYAPLAYLVMTFVQPTYEAFSLLEVQPAQLDLFKSGLPGTPSLTSILPYLQTQVELITSDPVLDLAISDPSVVNLPMIKKSNDPKNEIREKMAVDIVGRNTYLIRVALESPDPVASARIVKAVVEAYVRQHTMDYQNANETLSINLQHKVGELDRQIEIQKHKLKMAVEQESIEVPRPALKAKAAEKDLDQALQPSFRSVTEEQYARLADRLIQADLELIDAQVRFETAKLAKVSDEKLRELGATVENAKKKKNRVTQYIDRVEVKAKPQRNTTLEVDLLNQELMSSMKWRELIREKIAQLEFEANQQMYRILVRNPAAAPSTPSNIKQLRYLAAVPTAVFFLVLGLFFLWEIKAQRVADPVSPSMP